MKLVSSTHTLEITEEEREGLLHEAGTLTPTTQYPFLIALYFALDASIEE